MNKIYTKIYEWMFIGLLITFLTGYIISNNEIMISNIFSSSISYLLLIFIELGIALVLPSRINKMSYPVASVLFIIFSFITGLTFSVYFVIYELTSIIWVFLVTSIIFIIFAIIGHTTKIDLTKFGTFLTMGLLGILILELINLFICNSTLDIGLCIVSLILFMGFIAYDIKKIDRLHGYILESNLPVIGAFELYLDFINIFIDLIKLFGKKRD